MNTTPNSNRKHIGIFGKTNAGKSSLLNAILEQDLSIVSNIPGTTTDAVTKAMELLPFGPVLFIDTAGLNDKSELGELRVKKTIKELKRTDLALYITDGTIDDFEFYEEMKKNFKIYNIPHILIINKCDLLSPKEKERLASKYKDAIFISTNNRISILNLKSKLVETLTTQDAEPNLISDLVPFGGTVVLVVPIDSEAPKGRIILPQVQLIRDCLDSGIASYVVRDTELQDALLNLKNISLVVTDSQAFKFVDSIVNNRFPLTSFSILFARQKGELDIFIKGVEKIQSLKDGDNILIAETCTHNTSHEDIGRYKIPNLLKKVTGKNFNYTFSMGKDFPTDLSNYSLVIHCGGCMINRQNMLSRIKEVTSFEIPMTNYGIILAYLSNILEKSLSILKNNSNS